mgnify:CR=1 FL=1
MDVLASLPRPTEGRGAAVLAEVLARAILSGLWQPGDVFPRELDLCQHFEASRNRVRNALAELSSAGLIERTAGRGTLVRDIVDWHLLDPQMSGWMASLDAPHPQLVEAVFAFRLAAEPYIGELAAHHATGEDLACIERAFEGMRDTADTPEQRLAHAEHDVAFHDAIYRASHNLVWRQMGLLLRPSIVALIQRSQRQADGPDDGLTDEPSGSNAPGLSDSLERHRQLLEAIRLKQPKQARRATELLLERTARDLGNPLPGNGVASPTSSRA